VVLEDVPMEASSSAQALHEDVRLRPDVRVRASRRAVVHEGVRTALASKDAGYNVTTRSGELAIDAVLERWATDYKLTAAEVALLRAVADGIDRAVYAETRMIAYGTVKKQGQAIIDKTGDVSLERAANRLLREALETMGDTAT
jgi:DNA-binding NarL/FixJ family response regulator